LSIHNWKKLGKVVQVGKKKYGLKKNTQLYFFFLNVSFGAPISSPMASKKPVISLTEAAKRLEYASTKSVKDLIKRGMLSSFRFHHTSRIYVSAEEVDELMKPIPVHVKEK
tara:strand:- start:44 stop:376 length:333 start_codon:yes stop_codon:yes gene_type:complete